MRILLTTLAVAALACGALAQSQNLVYLTNDTDHSGSTSGTGIAGDIGNDLVDAATLKVAIADINADGFDDVFFLNHNALSVGMLNDGGGVFSADANGGDLYSATTSVGAKGVAWANFDGDMDLDCFVATGPVGGMQQQNAFLENNSAGGDSSFSDITGSMTVGGDKDHSYDAAFLMIDGQQHLAVANRIIGGDAANGGQNRLYSNLGGDFVNVPPVDGEFQADNVAEIMSSRDLIVADFDNDGDDDLFVANAGNGAQENRMYVQVGGVLVRDDYVSDPGASYGATAADLDMDGDPDLLIANRATASSGSSNGYFQNLSSLLGGDNVEMARVDFTVLDDSIDPSYDVLFADLDSDGDMDVFVANNTANNKVFINTQVELGLTPFEAGSFVEVTDGLLQSNRGATRSAVAGEFGDYGPNGNHQAMEVVFANTQAGNNEFYRGAGLQFFDMAGGTSGNFTPLLAGDGFFSPTTGGSLVSAGGAASRPAFLALDIVNAAIPFNGGTAAVDVFGSGTAFVSGAMILDGTGGLTISVEAGDIPASMSGELIFGQVITLDAGLPGGVGITNGLSIVIQ
ncbi:MAG: hypothetical protein DRQ55_02245 [Planctomycetota bacterium]|nr:MAG: hypothetical protein DRQ55_02245 [Planctomycetota bacterium]